MKRSLLARAAGRDGKPSAEAVLVFEHHVPHYQDHRNAEAAITKAFEESFGETPVQVGSATLPYVSTDEGDDE